jgi:glutathione S-transferase
MERYIVFGGSDSGNCYKVKLLLTQLGLPFEWRETDPVKQDTRKPEYLALNPAGKVPLLEIEPGKLLPESNAILCYLADGTSLWSGDRYARAQVLQWLFFEQYSHEPYIAVARFINKYLPEDHPRRADLPGLREKGYTALKVMEQHLSQREFFVGDRYSIADIALFAYTHVSFDGGFDLSPFLNLKTWIERIRQQPGFIAIG